MPSHQINRQWIFLPGASGSRQFWQPVASRCCPDGDYILMHYPGFDGEPAQMSVSSFESLQSYVIDQIGEPTVLVAQSMGGIFAVQAALQKPNLIQALVLVATSGGIDLTPFNVEDWRVRYLAELDVPDWFVTSQSRAIAQALDSINCPILLIWGDQDSVSPIAVGQYLQQRFKHAELHVIEGGQHDLANVYAQQVSRIIQEFMQGIA